MYHAAIAVSLIPFALVFLDIDSGGVNTSRLDSKNGWILIVVLLVAIFAICLSVWRNAKEKLANIGNSVGIKSSLVSYLNFQTKRFFMLEAGAIISLLGLWLTTNYIFVIAYLLVLVQFSLLRPSQDKVIRDLRFNKQEREQLKGDKL